MKKTITILLLFALLLSFTSCGCEHEWQDATCKNPKICSLCYKTEGTILEHTWEEATCQTPKTCSFCYTTDGDPLEHTWINATCTTPKICEKCQFIGGEELGHQYKETIILAETCTKNGNKEYTCTLCQNTFQEEIEKKGHTNVLQSNGSDICSTCKEKTFTTASVKALLGLYSQNKLTRVTSIYADFIKWENTKCIAVVVDGFGTSDFFVTIIDVNSNSVLSYDMVGDMEKLADDYISKSKYLYGEDLIEYRREANNCLNKAIWAVEIARDKGTELKCQDHTYIDQLARNELEK